MNTLTVRSSKITPDLQTFDAEAARWSRVFDYKWRTEIELASILARSPRYFRAILEHMGIGPADFGHDHMDPNRLIVCGIWIAGEPFGPPLGMAGVIRPIIESLKTVNAWDQEDTRQFVCETWNPMNLSRLLSRGPNSESLLVQRAARLGHLSHVIAKQMATRTIYRREVA